MPAMLNLLCQDAQTLGVIHLLSDGKVSPSRKAISLMHAKPHGGRQNVTFESTLWHKMTKLKGTQSCTRHGTAE